MSRRALIVRFTLLEVLYWCSIAAFSSFALAYLQNERGVTDGGAGLLILLMTGGAFIGQFIWGAACDRLGTHKWLFLVACSLQLPLCFALFYARSFTMLCIFYALLGFVQGSMPANIDTWLIKSFSETPGIFGPIRSGGSLAYAVFTYVYGWILEAAGYSVMLIFVTSFIVLGAAVALTTPDVRTEQIGRAHSRAASRALVNRRFVLLMFALLCIGICSSVYQFFQMMMRGVGGSVNLLGITIAISGLTQVPFMLFGNRLTRITVKARVLIGCFLYVFMGLLFAFATRPLHIILGSVLSGSGYGIIFPSVRQWVFELSSPESRTTAQGIADAVMNSLGGMVSSGAIGMFADGIGLKPILLACVGAQVVGILALFIPEKRRMA